MPEPTPTPAPMSDTRAMMLRLTLTSWESTMAAAATAERSCWCACSTGDGSAAATTRGGGSGGSALRGQAALQTAARAPRHAARGSNWAAARRRGRARQASRRPHLRHVQLLTLCTVVLQVHRGGLEGPAGKRSGGSVLVCRAAALGGPGVERDAMPGRSKFTCPAELSAGKPVPLPEHPCSSLHPSPPHLGSRVLQREICVQLALGEQVQSGATWRGREN